MLGSGNQPGLLDEVFVGAECNSFHEKPVRPTFAVPAIPFKESIFRFRLLGTALVAPQVSVQISCPRQPS